MTTAFEGQKPSVHQLESWKESFHRDGYLVFPGLLSKERCAGLRAALDRKLAEESLSGEMSIQTRMFEHSPQNLALFDLEPLVTFAEQLIGDCNSEGFNMEHGITNANKVHVIHNNSFMTPGLTNGLGNNTWHQDDTPHVLSLDGKPLTNVRINVLLFTVNFYLTDVLDVKNGPTQVIPGSHMFGRSVPEDLSDYKDQFKSCLGPAGTAVCFNNQVWHRGSRNDTEDPRYITQVTYAKRLIGHKYDLMMNYQMPEHIYKGANRRLKRLLGFLPPGAYS